MTTTHWHTLTVLLSTLVTLILFFLPSRYSARARKSSNSSKPPSENLDKCSVQIVVLGDIGRSPRMQYHARSIAKHGGKVQLIGYSDRESKPLAELSLYPNLSIVSLSQSPPILQTDNKSLFLITAPVKVLLQIWTLWQTLAYGTVASKWMLVQNPPSIPTLAIAALVCYLRGTRLVIDWHNFGYSILAMKLGNNHPLVIISKRYEQAFARFAYAHFTVTNVMCEVLKEDRYVPIDPKKQMLTLHDRPAPIFQPLSSTDRLIFINRCSLITEAERDDILTGKMKIVVSSTSWTADEDFTVLLDALVSYSASAISDSPQLPELLVIITGKGPQKQYYLNKIQELEAQDALEMVTIKTAWLSFEDYASLLGSADLGVSLHTSSSGVDLPMKVVDMFGAGLPVLGFDGFTAWSELVTEKISGRGFRNADMMGRILKELFDPENETSMQKLREGALKESKRRWDDEWDDVAGKLFALVDSDINKTSS